ncbi:ATP-binding protein [Burkholderia gladioli]|uniref:ATP-binding protein n=1 Tax=Burkholderia gladioli TaxID=28095 RepID=UPI00163FE2F3|nr:ATP-binding protein [Burkholderia gladioli]
MSFQAAVATWCAAHIVADMPVGDRFGLAADLNAIAIQCETGSGLDDVVLTLSDGGEISVQCKTQLSLDTSGTSALAKVLTQVVMVDDAISKNGKDIAKFAAVVAVAERAFKSLDNLETALRAFDLGEGWAGVRDRLADAPKRALDVFELHVRAGWASVHGGTPTDADLARLARQLRIRRFGEDATSADWRESSYLLGRRVYGGEENGAAPLETLNKVSRRLIRSGALADRDGLMRELRAAGHMDLNSPGFDADFARVKAYSDSERRRLKRHTELPIGDKQPLSRECLTALRACCNDGPLLVTGEPGAGKTGVLLSLAEDLTENGLPVVFLSVERLAGISTIDDFRRQLLLEHELLQVLIAWPGGKPGLLIIDALDASRGGPGEAVIASFIEDAIAKLDDRWSVVASIRSFDLRNGRRFQILAKGRAPESRYAEKGLEGVRHFQIPRLLPAEIEAAGQQAPELGVLYKQAPTNLQILLTNIFNLSIAAELLASGTPAESIRVAATQAELLEIYENARMPSHTARRAARVAVETMIAQRKLSVRSVDIASDDLDDLLQSGVANEADDLVSFVHHVLFDHIAGRFYLDWNNPATLREQLSSDPLAGLMLSPALRFALEMVWSADNSTRDKTWKFLVDLATAELPAPVVVSVANRTAAEKVQTPDDLLALRKLITADPDCAGLAAVVNQVARFVDLGIKTIKIADTTIVAWAQLAETAALSRDRRLADGARVLIWSLIETADFSRSVVLEACGAAARALLSTAWSFEPELSHLNTMAIRMVTRTYASDSMASRALLQRILSEDRLEAHAADEVPWLAEGVKAIVAHDPTLATEIYRVLFAFEPKEDAKTWVGGAPSRILSLTSTVRQDYEHARWHLKEALPYFLETSPERAVQAVIQALAGLSGKSYRSRHSASEVVEIGVGEVRIIISDNLFGPEDWREEKRRPGDSEDEILSDFVEFLRTCTDNVFIQTVEIISKDEAGAAVWARILGIAADSRPGLVDDKLWALASEPRFTAIQGLARDAIIFLSAVYGKRSLTERAAFEEKALDKGVFKDKRKRTWWRAMLSRFLSIVPEAELVTPTMKAFRGELAAANELRGNEPFMTITSSRWGDADADIVDSLLREEGVDFNDDAVKRIREASRAVEALLRPSDENGSPGLAELWERTHILRQLLDESHEPSLPEALVHSSWGAVSNAVERIAQDESCELGVDGLPSVNELVDLAICLGMSPFPRDRQRDNEDESLGWGNWDVRVYAAIAVSTLARRFGSERTDLIEAMAAFLDDSEPTVRLQVAQRLNGIWDVANERMWVLFEKIAQTEPSIGVLGFFVGGPMSLVARADPKRVVAIIADILQRLNRTPKEGGRDQFCEAVGGLIAWIYVVCDEPSAWRWLERWTENIVEGLPYIASVLHTMRDVFFFRYKAEPNEKELAMQDRAMKLLQAVVENGGRGIAEATLHLKDTNVDDPTIEHWRRLYISADQMIDQAGSQLYFGSGAFQSSGREADGLGVSAPEEKRAFLCDYNAIIDGIATAASPRTLHYLLQTLEYLVDGAPEAIFDKVGRVLLDRGAAEGYHFESMAVEELVKLVERYLADYRALFEDSNRRKKLIEIIELFAKVGWPKALKLLYDLPDLLR